MILMKFGGTSVADAERITAVMDIIERHLDREPVVAVSALSGVTNLLIEAARAASRGEDSVYREAKATLLARHLGVVDKLLAKSMERIEVAGLIEDRLHEFELLCRSIAVLGEITARGYDAVSSIGEQLSARILASALSARGIRARDVLATQLIITDDHFGSARPRMDITRRQVRTHISPLLERGVVPVVTGYIGATEEGITTVLGRGGGDYSAAILGACLEAEEVQIWTDVDGILTADPHIVPDALTLDALSYEEAEELAYYGADVLHPKTLGPVQAAGIPMRILNSFNPAHTGTLITAHPSTQRRALPAILSTKGLSLIAIAGNGDSWGPFIAARVLESLAEAGVEMLFFVQPMSERSLNLVVRQRDTAHSLRVLRTALEGFLRLGTISQVDVREEVGTISVVGRASAEPGKTVPRAFAALGRRGTRIISVAQSSAGHNISFVVPQSDVDDTVRYIHSELGLDRNLA